MWSRGKEMRNGAAEEGLLSAVELWKDVLFSLFQFRKDESMMSQKGRFVFVTSRKNPKICSQLVNFDCLMLERLLRYVKKKDFSVGV
jgi:hypothetical protein